MSDVPPHDQEAEAAVLGSVLMTAKALEIVSAEDGLRAEHFYLPRHRLVFEAMQAVQDQGGHVDALTTIAELKRTGELERAGGEAYVHSLPTTVPAVGAVRDYAQVVVRLWRWRLRREVGTAYIDAAHNQDEEAFAQAEQRLGRAEVGGRDSRSFTPEQLADDFFDLLGKGGIPGWPLPFVRLTDALNGGLRRGGLTLVGGHTSHGKSVFADQCLHDAAVNSKLECHAYINEMDHQERTARMLAYITGVDQGRIVRDDLGTIERKAILRVLNQGLPFGITDAHGWSVLDIARHVRHHRFDLVVVDLLHLIPAPQGVSRADGLGQISGALKRLAGITRCHVIATVHLNEGRVQTAIRPHPTLGDIRDSGQPKNDADNVIFVYLDQDEDTGRPKDTGLIYLAKARGGKLDGIYVELDGPCMRFRETSRLRSAA